MVTPVFHFAPLLSPVPPTHQSSSPLLHQLSPTTVLAPPSPPLPHHHLPPLTPLQHQSSASELTRSKNTFTHHYVASIPARSLYNFQIKLFRLLLYITAAARLIFQVGWKPFMSKVTCQENDMSREKSEKDQVVTASKPSKPLLT